MTGSKQWVALVVVFLLGLTLRLVLEAGAAEAGLVREYTVRDWSDAGADDAAKQPAAAPAAPAERRPLETTAEGEGTPQPLWRTEVAWADGAFRDLCVSRDAEDYYERLYGSLPVVPLAAELDDFESWLDRQPDQEDAYGESYAAAFERLSAANSLIRWPSADTYQCLAYRAGSSGFAVSVGSDLPGRGLGPDHAMMDGYRRLGRYANDEFPDAIAHEVQTLLTEWAIQRERLSRAAYEALHRVAQSKIDQGRSEADAVAFISTRSAAWLIKAGDDAELDTLLRRRDECVRMARYRLEDALR